MTARTDAQNLIGMLSDIRHTMKKNKVLRRNAIGGHIVVAMYGVELSHSSKRELPGALERTHSNGTEDNSKCCRRDDPGGMQKVVPGQTMLDAGDGGTKYEGQVTGVPRLLCELHETFGHFAYVLATGRPVLNAPLKRHADDLDMNRGTSEKRKMHAVRRLSAAA